MNPPKSDRDFKPLVLPRSGTDLLPGFQYWLPPIARTIIADVYGIRDIPSVVECLLKAAPATFVQTVSTNLETGEYHVTSETRPAQSATFKAFYSLHRVRKVELNLEFMWERQEATADAHKFPVTGRLRHGWLVIPDPEEESRTIKVQSSSGLSTKLRTASKPKAAKADPLANLDLSIFGL